MEKVSIKKEESMEKLTEKKIEEEEETLLREELVDTVLDKTWLTEDDIKIIINNECCTS